MTDVTKLLKKYESLIRATTVKYTRGFRPSRHIGNLEDHIAEATVAAWKALATYRDDKSTKVETYMIGCIRNRLIDIDRTANRGGRPELTFEADELNELVADSTIEAVEERITYERVLDQDEYETLCHFLDGGGIEQLVAARCRKTKGERRLVRMEITQCLHHIRHKLESRGLSLSV